MLQKLLLTSYLLIINTTGRDINRIFVSLSYHMIKDQIGANKLQLLSIKLNNSANS